MSKNKNCHDIINDLEADVFRRKNIQAVTNTLFFTLSFQHFTEISNGFMTIATITKRLREDLNLDVHPSTVAKARKHVLGYIYRRSKCKPSASESFIIS